MSDEPWPAGHPDEASIRAEMERKAEKIAVTITRGDLERLDKMITLFEAMAELFTEDFYDDAWNMRNAMVPFVPGDKLFDEPTEGET